MAALREFGLSIHNYKSFADAGGGFDELLPINVIIGRNNTGKSALVDAVEFCCKGASPPNSMAHAKKLPQVVLRATLNEDILRTVFPENFSGGYISGNHWHDYGRHFVGNSASMLIGNNRQTFLSTTIERMISAEHKERLAQVVTNPLSTKTFHRLTAERDIMPETASDVIAISPNGFLNSAEQSQEFIIIYLLIARSLKKHY